MSRESLLQAILDRPDDDAPRLAYADAIAKRSAARAEFIRAQVALAQPARLDALERRRLRQRVKELAKSHGGRWRSALPALDGIVWNRHFTRGFLASCTARDLTAFRTHAAAIRAAVPLEQLAFERLTAADLPALLQMLELAGLRRLYLPGYAARGNHFKDAEAARIAGCPHLANLRELVLHDHEIGDAGVRALAESPHLGRLRYLNLIQNEVGPEGVRALAYSTRLTALNHIDLYGNEHDGACLIDLATSPLAHRLRVLGAGGGRTLNAINADAARALAESPALGKLRSLDLNNTRIGDAGLMYLACSPHLVRLRELYLRQADLGDAGVAVVLRSPLAARLRVLDIEAANITEHSAWEMVSSPDLAGLRKLKLWDCDNLFEPVCRALKRRFGKRVEVHVSSERRMKRHATSRPQAVAFMEEIRAHPDDDAPRLVFADWLEDNGDPARAEFIRVQIRRATLPIHAPEQRRLATRERQLLSSNGQRWTEGAFLTWLGHTEGDCPMARPHTVCKVMAEATPVRMELDRMRHDSPRRNELQEQLNHLGKRLEKCRVGGYEASLPFCSDYAFHRGMLEHVTIDEAMFFDFTPAVRDLGVVRHLHIEYDENDLELGDYLIGNLIACMDAPRLITLKLGTEVHKLASIEALAAWPGAAELTALSDLQVWRVPGDDVLRVLAVSPYLKRLTRLDLALFEGYTDAGVRAIVDSPNLPNLAQVRLYSDEAEVTEQTLSLARQRFTGGFTIGE